MKRLLILGVALVLTATLVGCGGSSDATPTIFTQIFSDPTFDGDIAFDPTPPGTYTITTASATASVLAGIDPVSGVEYRGFLNFPLGGAGGVPPGAIIVSATLEIFINQVVVEAPDTTVPILMDLVSFQPPTVASDFDRITQPPLASKIFPVFTSDAGSPVPVSIDVTGLMQEAQRLVLPDFQVRLLLDFSAGSGRIAIDDIPTDTATAPLLTVEYF